MKWGTQSSCGSLPSVGCNSFLSSVAQNGKMVQRKTVPNYLPLQALISKIHYHISTSLFLHESLQFALHSCCGLFWPLFCASLETCMCAYTHKCLIVPVVLFQVFNYIKRLKLNYQVLFKRQDHNSLQAKLFTIPPLLYSCF